MKVCLISRKFDKDSGSGVWVYSDKLKSSLRKRGINVVTIKQTFGLNSFYMKMIHDLIVIPIKVLFYYITNRKTVFHALSENQTFFMPLLNYRNSVVTVHDLMRFNQRWFWKKIYENCTKAQKIIVNSSDTKKDLKNNIKVLEEKIEIIPPGIEESLMPLETKKEKFIVGYIGGTDKRKNVESLLLAYKLLKENYDLIKTELHIYGAGNGLFGLKELSKKLELKNVKFGGIVPRKNINRVYNSFSAFVFPTKYEGFGVPILEAMKCGVPVFVNKSAKIPSEITKYCLKYENELNLAKMLCEFKNNKKYEKQTKDSIKYVSRFSWESCVKKHIEVYESIIQQT